MKANELMIGDWLQVNKSGFCIKRGTIVRVCEIDEHNRFDKGGLVGSAFCEAIDNYSSAGIWVKCLSPIPLTPEILEKNGFGYTEGGFGLTHFYLGEPCFCKNMDLHIGTDNEGNFWLNYGRNSIYGLRYVHELQHALRDCKTEKEIETIK